MAKKTNMLEKLGAWAFIIGVVIALIVGVIKPAGTEITTSILILLGLIVGFLNVTGRETTPFLLTSVSLVIVSKFGGEVLGQVSPPAFGAALSGVLSAIMIFVIPATIIVALKAIYALAHDD